MPTRNVEIIGHRGASHDAPENTMASFRLAWRQGADAVELDVRMSKDGRIMVIHDATTRRTTGTKGRVSLKTHDHLRTLDAGSGAGGMWNGEQIPTLDEVVTAIPEGRRLFVEIKCGTEALPEIARVLKAAGTIPGQIVLIGFERETMRKAKQMMPECVVCWVVSYAVNKKTGRRPKLPALIEKATAAQLDGLDLDRRFPIDREFVSEVNAAGLQLYVWTVDDPKIAARLVEAGVSGITTNRPGWMRGQLDRLLDR